MELLSGYDAVGLTLHLPEHDTLVFADVHLGYEEMLNREGVLVPHFQFNDVVSYVKEAVKQTRPSTIIINGDLKHEFGGISGQEWREVLQFLKLFDEYDVKLVKGNHDNILGPIARKRNVEVLDEVRLGPALFVHGHIPPEDLRGVETVVIGHEHPCVGLREEGRVEKVKCFLVGEWEGRCLIVLPSLNFIAEGVDVLQENTLSPLLQGDIGGFRAYGVEEGEILYFGELKQLSGDF